MTQVDEVSARMKRVGCWRVRVERHDFDHESVGYFSSFQQAAQWLANMTDAVHAIIDPYHARS